jgi:menaquinone-specific isochorismate synthase
MTQTDNASYSNIPAQYGRLISTHIPCPNMTLSKFLLAARGQQRFYWESSRDNVAFAASGTSLELMAWGKDRFETIRHHAVELFADVLILDEQESLASPRLFGGFSFRDDFVPDVAWSDFTPAHFVLPHYQLVRVDEQYWLTINAHVPYGESPIGFLPDLREALEAKAAELQSNSSDPSPAMKHSELSYPMQYETWQTNIVEATNRMKAGELKKVVLSRVAEVRFDDNVTIDHALDFLAKKYPETYRFLFEPRPYHAFYGATPELLASVKRNEIKTMALAGSIPRGKTPEQDKAYAQELFNSKKDRYEHQLVIDGILTRLEPLTKAIEVGETGIIALSNIQHIQTAISATMREANGIIPIVEALHPTPALGGSPREIAIKLIGEYEPVPRGWYAAPVGWIDSNMDGQFGVAIRSAVAQAKRVWLYSGAGIVADSDPQKEWDETAWKFTPMLNALGIQSSG